MPLRLPARQTQAIRESLSNTEGRFTTASTTYARHKFYTVNTRFDNKGCERGKGKFIDYEVDEVMWGDMEEYVEFVIERAESDLLLSQFRRRQEAERLAALPKTEPYKRPSKEAMRKRIARKEGRVKARPLKPARTEAQKVESWRKAYETRQAAWMALSKPGAPILTAAQLGRMAASMNRAHITWQLALSKCKAVTP